MTGGQCVCTIQSNRTDKIVDLIGVGLDAAACLEHAQTIPVARDMGQLFTEAGLGLGHGRVVR